MDASPHTNKKKRKSAQSENAGLSKRFVHEKKTMFYVPQCSMTNPIGTAATNDLVAHPKILSFLCI